MTRNDAGTASNRSETSSRMQCRHPPQAQTKAFRLDHLFDTGKMLRKGAAIGRAFPGDPAIDRSICLILGMHCCHGRFHVLQCQIELVGIGLLGLAPEGSLLKSDLTGGVSSGKE